MPYDTWIEKLGSLEMDQTGLREASSIDTSGFLSRTAPRNGVQREDLEFETKESKGASHARSGLEAASNENMKAWLRQSAY